MTRLSRDAVPERPAECNHYHARGYDVYDAVEADGSHVRWRYFKGKLVAFFRYFQNHKSPTHKGSPWRDTWIDPDWDSGPIKNKMRCQ